MPRTITRLTLCFDLLGLLGLGERYNKVVDIWSRTGDTIADAMMRKIKEEPVKDLSGKILKDAFE